MCYAKMALEIKDQTEAFKEGFSEIVPSEALSLLNEKEFGLKLAGMPNIDCKNIF